MGPLDRDSPVYSDPAGKLNNPDVRRYCRRMAERIGACQLLNAGIVGPSAGGESFQNSVHKVIGSRRSNGWANQLHNEVPGQLVYEHRWRGVLQTSAGGIGVDVSPHMGFSLGNIATYANVGLTLRVGNDLRNDYGVPRIRPSLPGSSFFETRDGFGWSVFAGVDGLAVLFRRARLSYTYVVRGKKYEGQEDLDCFGALSLSFRF